ncbi:hypothetical protein BZB76_1025 [Actinomadura pelletieri DSM 43383]|uniref:CU044_5270 family protein n=1 Tax=Actinomadura pelletieri DSM 43383 TaxID=1120940 RepID=A0A495R013_9ACTN|nr:hypothetical protein [Actinomadura pelletieri]RKS79554.1 hypothetical protein BZB76_1025 [Actinomadura pelletieri DSM 43383]
MDDLRIVKEAYGEPAAPTPREMTEARARMFEEPTRSRRRSGSGFGFGFGWRARAGIGLVAVGAAAAVTIVALGSGSSTPTESAESVDIGKLAVLAAAEKAERQPTGKFWHTDTVSGQAYIVRAKTGNYAIFGAQDESFSWAGAERGMGEAYYGRDLPAHPQTARDAELWRKAGSPSRIRVWSGDHYATYTTKATAWRSDGPNVGVDPKGGGTFVDGKSAAQLRKLPTDPEALAAMFLGGTSAGDDPARRAGVGTKDAAVRRLLAATKIMRTSAVLRAPIPPKARSGLMRALAAQPGVHAVGRVADPLGRRGVALAGDEHDVTVTGEYGTSKAEQGTYRSRQVIVFDERTGALLSRQEMLTVPGGPYAEMKPGFIIEYQANRSAGWTDAKPKPPVDLPF